MRFEGFTAVTFEPVAFVAFVTCVPLGTGVVVVGEGVVVVVIAAVVDVVGAGVVVVVSAGAVVCAGARHPSVEAFAALAAAWNSHVTLGQEA